MIALPIALISVGLLALILMRIGMTVALRSTRAPRNPKLRPLTVLKPLKGVDAGLEANLRTIFEQDYPQLQIVLGSPDADDPALEVARKLAAEYPQVDAQVVFGSLPLGFNPKVCSLANLMQHARHELILISDSNIRAPEGYLEDLSAYSTLPKVGLVTSPFRGVGAMSLGGFLEQLQFNTVVAGGKCALNTMTPYPCVVGKSMLLHRDDLEAIGGFATLAQFLGEDQVSGLAVVKLRKRVVVADLVIDNVVGAPGMRAFFSRQLRWAAIRRSIAPVGYFFECLLNPISIALVALCVMPQVWMFGVFLATILLKAMLEASMEWRLGVKRHPIASVALAITKDLCMMGVWVRSLFPLTLAWRGDRVRIGAGSRVKSIIYGHQASATPAPASSAPAPQVLATTKK